MARNPDSIPPMVLVGTKLDLEAMRVVQPQEASELAQSLGCISHFETSAKTPANVEDPFRALVEEVMRRDCEQRTPAARGSKKKCVIL